MVALLFATLIGLTWSQRVPSIVRLKARFQELPDNDRALANWIRTQPNVYKAVSIARLDPDRKRLVVWIPVSFHIWRHTSIPDLDNNVSRSGYLGSDGPFRFSSEDSLYDFTSSDEP